MTRTALTHMACTARPKGVLTFYHHEGIAREACRLCGYDAPIQRRPPDARDQAGHGVKPHVHKTRAKDGIGHGAGGRGPAKVDPRQQDFFKPLPDEAS